MVHTWLRPWPESAPKKGLPVRRASRSIGKLLSASTDAQLCSELSPSSKACRELKSLLLLPALKSKHFSLVLNSKSTISEQHCCQTRFKMRKGGDHQACMQFSTVPMTYHTSKAKSRTIPFCREGRACLGMGAVAGLLAAYCR